MDILSPKSHFMGGGLISLVHLARVVPSSKIFTFDTSEVLDAENIKYEVLETSKVIECNDVWVNDTCGDDGYDENWWQNDDFKKATSLEFLEFLRTRLKANTVYLVNHQPINRCYKWLLKVIRTLTEKGSRVHLLNYRANWNDEFKYYCEPLLRNSSVVCSTLPYFYSPDLMSIYLESSFRKTAEFMAVGRSQSRSKISYYHPMISKILNHITITPSPTITLHELLMKLSESRMILTGYYWDHSGMKESDVPFNKLEWSYIDSLMAGSIPVTSTLFKSELNRLGFDKMPLLSYEGPTEEEVDSLYQLINSKELKEYANELADALRIELLKGNELIQGIFIS